MEIALIITVNLKGELCGPVVHTDSQVVSFEKRSVKIIHNNRKEQVCYKRIQITDDVIKYWLNECPKWEKQSRWKMLTNNQKIQSHVNKFDEGFGVKFEKI